MRSDLPERLGLWLTVLVHTLRSLITVLVPTTTPVPLKNLLVTVSPCRISLIFHLSSARLLVGALLAVYVCSSPTIVGMDCQPVASLLHRFPHFLFVFCHNWFPMSSVFFTPLAFLCSRLESSGPTAHRTWQSRRLSGPGASLPPSSRCVAGNLG